MHHLQEHINQDIYQGDNDKDSTVNKTEYRSKRNSTGKPLQTANPHKPSHLKISLPVRPVIETEVRPADV